MSFKMSSQFFVSFFVLAALALMEGVFCLKCQQCCYTDDTTGSIAVPQMAGDSAIVCAPANMDCLFGAKKFEQDCGTGDWRCLSALRSSSTPTKQVLIRMCQKKTPDSGSPNCDGTEPVTIKAGVGPAPPIVAIPGDPGLTHCCDDNNCITKDDLWTKACPEKPNAASRTGFNFMFFLFIFLVVKFF
ncbi:uncharacterized protein LOC135499117 [Lineus longissimus]|uniref:uncharacterized protein LOC135499117 n=1 Tax=Lineus longissimus TaxID=88925 RepID=UPI002B4D0568